MTVLIVLLLAWAALLVLGFVYPIAWAVALAAGVATVGYVCWRD